MLVKETYKKYSFPHRSTDVQNSLCKEIVNARGIHGFKAKLYIKRYGDGIAPAYLLSHKTGY